MVFPGHLVIAGDFNFHVDVPDNPQAQKLLDIIDSFGLTQTVCGPTHKAGHTLDLIITRSDNNTITDTKQTDPCLSDHLAVHFMVSIPWLPHPTKTITYRKTKSIVVADFIADLSCLSPPNNSATLNDLTDDYNNTLLQVLDKHAPEQTKTITVRSECDWFNDDLLAQKREVGCLKRVKNHSGLTIDI